MTVQPRPSLQRTATDTRKRRERKGSIKNAKENVTEDRWDRNGRLKRRQTNVRVVRERGEEGGEGKREKGGKEEGDKGVKVSTVQEDHQVKTRLAMETRVRQEPSQTTATVRVSNCSSD